LERKRSYSQQNVFVPGATPFQWFNAMKLSDVFSANNGQGAFLCTRIVQHCLSGTNGSVPLQKRQLLLLLKLLHQGDHRKRCNEVAI
jgi:hypothetical protein